MKILKGNMLVSYIMIMTGSVICAFGLNCFLLPYKLTMGGYSGFASVMYHILGLSVGAGMMMLNIPTFIIAYRFLGRRFFIRSLYALGVFMLASELIPITAFAGDMFIAAVYGGLLMGLGLGVNLYCGGSTGGTDLLAVMINKKFQKLPVSTVLFIVDALAVILTAITAGFEEAMYSLISVGIVIKFVDVVTEGTKSARVFIIITQKYSDVKRVILDNLNRGVTEFPAKGGFSGKNIKVLLCTVDKGKETILLKKMIEETDESAFVISLDAREVAGRGFNGNGA